MSLPATAQASQQRSGAQSSSNILMELGTNPTASQYDSYASKGFAVSNALMGRLPNSLHGADPTCAQCLALDQGMPCSTV